MSLETKVRSLIERTKEEYQLSKFRGAFHNIIQRSSSDIIIAPHRFPDDDCICSALATQNIIYRMYPKRNSTIVIADRNPGRWDDLLQRHRVICTKDDQPEKEILDYCQPDSPIVFLDASTSDRFVSTPAREKEIGRLPNSIVIDHHENSSLPAALQFIDVNAAASGAILAQIFNVHWMDAETCRLLAYSIFQDTVHFEVITKKNAKVFSLFEKLLIGSGLDMRELESRFEISEEIDPYLREFWRNSKRVNLPIDGETTCIYSYLTAVNAKDTNVIQGAHRLFVPFQERFKNVELSFVLYPTAKENVYRVSFRSKQKLNVASLCESCFGGTGHEHAAGGHLKLELEEIAELSRLKQSANFEEMNYVTSLILDKTVHYFQSHNHL